MQIHKGFRKLLLMSCAYCQVAHAEGIIYFDVSGLLGYGALWVAALLLLLIGTLGALVSRFRFLAILGAVAFAGVLLAPFLRFADHQKKYDAEVQAALRNAAAETAFCKSELDAPSLPVPGEEAVSILLKVSDKAAAFPSLSSRYPNTSHQTDLAGIVRMLTDDWLICNRTRVRSIQTDLPGGPSILCHGESAALNLASTDRGSNAVYEMVIGEGWKESKYPEPETWGETRMAQASIRISERATGRILALKRSPIILSGEHGRSHECHHFVRELAEALAEVFPR